MKRFFGLVAFAFMLVAASAFAQPRPAAAPARPGAPARPAAPAAAPRRPAAAPNQPAGGVLNLGEILITGRPERPIATLEVSRIPAKLTLTELKQSFVDRIEEAAFKEPF